MKTRYMTKNSLKILQSLVIVAIVAVLLIGSAPVQPVSAALNLNTARPLGELLNPDGTINLNSGYRGSLDLSGWKLVSDSRQPPRFAPLAAGDGHWDGIFGRPGVNNSVNALAMDGLGNLYAGGNFNTAGAAIANYIAMWDGSDWTAVGGGLSSTVTALAIGPDDGYLYVAGNFQNAGGIQEADRIAVWDGSSWLPLGVGFASVVNALAFDSSGNLYAGGAFTNDGLNRVAMWDGSTWTALGSGIANQIVYGLAVDGNDDLYVGGSFTDAVGDLDYIAKWDGLVWSAVGTGLNGQVNALTISGGTDLYVGGYFTDAGGDTSADRIALWSGGNWSALGSGITNNAVFALTVDGSNLLVGGNFIDAGGNATADRIAIWSGSEWLSVETGVNNTVRAFALSGSGFYVGGDLTLAGAVVADRVVQWDGASWQPVGSGNGFNFNSIVLALTLDGDGNLYAGGTFTYAGSIEASRVAKWDGVSWSVLGSGTNGTVYALAVAADGSLYAGGSFSNAGGWTVNSVARWDGFDWAPLGSPPNVGVNGQVNSLLFDDAGNLYVAGTFSAAGGLPANRVAKWDGSSWSAFGDGLDNTVNVLALDDSGNLYAGGNFLNSGSNPVTRFAMWDGSTWSTVGGGLNGQPYAFLFDDSGNLYVGGAFTDAGGVAEADRVAIWDGSNWIALGTGTDGNVRDLALDGYGTLLVAGDFTHAGGVAANRIARWFDGSWHAMGSGTNQTIYQVSLESDWSIFVGGNFSTAGDKAQAYIARWFNIAPVAVDDSYSTPEEQVLTVPAPGVIENDYDDNDDALQASVITPPAIGALDLNVDGSFTYTPTLDYDDSVTFTYKIVDEYGGPDFAMVTISMEGTNDAPVAVNDYAFTFENVSISIPVLENDIDVDDDVLFVDEITGPFHGTAVISGTTEVYYDPDPGYIGQDSFYYVVSDGILTDTATIYITIDETNDPPVAQNDSYTTAEDTDLVVSAPGVLSNDTDPEDLPLTAILVSDPSHGAVTLNSDGSFTYIPAANFNGSDSFTYKANDEYNDSNVATVNLTITPVNDSPTPADDVYYVLFNKTLTVVAPGVLKNDTDPEGNSLTAALVDSPTHGTLTLYADGSFTYIPDQEYLGVDTFTYSVSDGYGGTATATVTINVVEVLPSQFMYVPMVSKH